MNDNDTCPKLYIWKNSRLYIASNPMSFRHYTLAWSQLLVCIDGEILLHQANGSILVTRTCLVKAGTAIDESYIDTSRAVIAIYYFNPISQDLFILQNEMKQVCKGVCYQHPTESALIKKLHEIKKKSLPPKQAYKLCQQAIIAPQLRQKKIVTFDARIIETIQNIRASFSVNRSVGEYAANVNLSESRLNKLFKRQIGIPITKYRLQIRLSVGIVLLAAGYSVTDAAYEAGFSSSAHFSTCFSDMIGIQPSTTFLKPPFMNIFIADEVLSYIHVFTARN